MYKKKLKKLKILIIFNKYKNIHKNFINNLNIKFLIISKRINMLNNNIFDFKNNLNNFKINKNFLNKLI